MQQKWGSTSWGLFCWGVAAVLLAALTPAAQAVPAYADLVFVVDESGSMSGEHAWIAQMVPVLEARLIAAGVGVGGTNRYGLVGFGSAAAVSRQINVGGGQFGTAAQFVAAAGGLVITGGTEDGYAGINRALNYTYRSDSARNIVLITDEDRDRVETQHTFTSIRDRLVNSGTLLNAVVNAQLRDGQTPARTALGIDFNRSAYIANGSGGFITAPGGRVLSAAGTTDADYISMAITLPMRGAAWDLNQLRSGGLVARSFTEAFVTIKVQEIINPVPEPGTLAIASLAGLGLFGYGWRRRRQA